MLSQVLASAWQPDMKRLAVCLNLVLLPIVDGSPVRASVIKVQTDADASGTSNEDDVTYLDDQLSNPPQNPDLVRLDQNRSGAFHVDDRTRAIRLLQGYHSTQQWDGIPLPARP